MATIGSIERYDPSSRDWEAYKERLEMFHDANAVAEGQRVATLLTVIGGTAYKIVRNLVAQPQGQDVHEVDGCSFGPFLTQTPRYCREVPLS